MTIEAMVLLCDATSALTVLANGDNGRTPVPPLRDARLFIPDRFMVRTAEQYSEALDRVAAHY
jgi:hypothetical protein